MTQEEFDAWVPVGQEKARWTVPTQAEPEEEAPAPEPHDDNRQAMVASISLMGNKGWNHERKVMVMHDYLMHRRLYTDFVDFIKKLR